MRALGHLRVTFTRISHNRKTGPIPVSITGRGSCPSACPFKDAGCYAEAFPLRLHWEQVPTKGLTWRAFCRAVAALPKGQLWRHNQAGDLPGRGDAIDTAALAVLVAANKGRKGFTFTHKPVTATRNEHRKRVNRRAIAQANAEGFTVNLSAESLAQADALADLNIGPVVVVVPRDAGPTYTPAGRKVIICPAQTRDDITCDRCQLCAIASRKAIVGFRAHGPSARAVSNLVQLRRVR
jgi:hypothetical protein